MIRATISEVKKGLSAYLRRVQSGESVLVLDRKTPVARIIPVGRALGHVDDADEADEGAMIARLERAGILSRPAVESPLKVLGEPFRAGAGILEALLDERLQEWRDGCR